MKRAFYLTGLLSFFFLCSCPKEELNFPPECRIISPDNGAEFFEGDTVEIIVKTWDENFHALMIVYSINGVEMEVDDWVDWNSTYNWDTEGFGYDGYSIGILGMDFHGGYCSDEITIILKQETASTD